MTNENLGTDEPSDNPDNLVGSTSPEERGSRSFGTWLKTSTWGSLLVLAAVAVAVLVAVWAVSAARNGAVGVDAEAGEGSTEAAGTSTAVEVPDSSAPAPEVGQVAPNFTATDIQGEEIDLESLRGKPVWLVFNATWCSNCRAELPDVEAAYQEYGEQVNIIGIYLSDSEQTLGEYSQRLGLTFPEIADPSSDLGALYRVMGVPTHYFIDDRGVVTAVDIGTLSPKMMDQRIHALLGDDQGAS